MVATAQLAKSDHPYANDFAYTWPAITEPEATQMRLHFTKLELASCDKLKVLNGDGAELVTYSGCYNGLLKEDFWTEWFTVDTMKIRLETNGEDNAYGFLIDNKETRKTLALATNFLAESDHPFANNFAYTWPAITEPGATQMRLHFTKLELASCDKLKVLNGDGAELVTYSGCYNGLLKEDFWTEWFTVDTMKIRLETNGEDNAYGFLIDNKETRKTLALVTNFLAESDHPFANDFAYTWPAITEPGATQMKLHFTKLELASCDKLKVLNGDGAELVTYSGCYNGLLKEDFWTEWFTVDTMKIRLETNGEDNAYGFLIDRKEIRAGTPASTPISTPILTPPSTNTPTYTTPPPPITTPKFTPIQTLTPPSTNTPTYTTPPPPITTPRFTPIQTLTPTPQYSFETEPTNTPTYTTAQLPISTLAPKQTHTPPPYSLETTYITETSEPLGWKSILAFLVLIGLIGIIFHSKNTNWQNSIWLYFVVAVIAGIAVAIFNKIWELS